MGARPLFRSSVAWCHATSAADVIPFSVRLEADVHTPLKRYTFFSGQSMNEVVGKGIGDHLVAHGDEIQDAIINDTRTRYRSVLDKLADL